MSLLKPRTAAPSAPTSRRPLRWPWWLGVILAIASYVGLCTISRGAGLLPALHGSSGPTASQIAAQVGLVALPVLCLIAALFAKRRERVAPLPTPDPHHPGHELSHMNWNDMMGLVTRVFSEMNYSVTERGQPNDIVSLRLKHDEHTFIVQCGHWASPVVGVDAVQALAAAIRQEGVTGGFLVSTGVYDGPAQGRTYLKEIGLIDGRRLIAMVERMQPDREANGPSCPLCNGPMMTRPQTADQAGPPPWTCANFPSCWGSSPKE